MKWKLFKTIFLGIPVLFLSVAMTLIIPILASSSWIAIAIALIILVSYVCVICCYGSFLFKTWRIK
jgi:Kef-type K+ transport system membrane component KefB